MTDKRNKIELFAIAARQFCLWCESPPNAGTNSDNLSFQARMVLAHVYSAIFTLPQVSAPESPKSVRPTDQQRNALRQKLKALPFQNYQVFFVPSQLHKQPVIGNLTDDLQDIYCDLKEGLWLFERDHIEAAAWLWHESFESHWGHHAANAIHALQGHTAYYLDT